MEKARWLTTALLIVLLISNKCFVSGQIDPSAELLVLEETMKILSRQLMLQQFYTEERIRSEGSSGVKQVRIHTSGSKNYYQDSFVGRSAATMHNHANNQRTVGMGELVVVMNGIEFRTRHNDYRLYMPHPNSSELHKPYDVPFPPVPESMKGLNLADGIQEMRQYFKAFKNQNVTHRDYRPYFKPLLCYMEGAWMYPKDKIDEPFESDRHFVDAKDWFDLMDKIRFTSYTGAKSHLENLAFLPTTIIGIAEDNSPIFAQWNYRIVCHPLKNDLPLSRLKVVDDLKSRMPRKRNINMHERTRSARFQINPVDAEEFKDEPMQYQFIDELMAEIPGKDSYQGSLEDQGFENPPLDPITNQPLDVSRYHRWYKSGLKDPMGSTLSHYGFSDDNLFVAMTTQSEVASLKFEFCDKDTGECVVRDQKLSYAFPLEIIYLTPLFSWNPYDIEYKGRASSDKGKTVTAGGRTGACIPGQELDGTNSKNFYITPAEFFAKGETEPDPADTTKDMSCVLDKSGISRKTKATGTRIHIPNIQDVGTIRQRYPIFPVHGEGSAVWKEVNAVKEMAMNPKALEIMAGIEHIKTVTYLQMSPSRDDGHTHYVELTEDEVEKIKVKGVKVMKDTTETNGHHHTLEITWDKWKDPPIFRYYTCDWQPKTELCSGRHPKPMFEVEEIPE